MSSEENKEYKNTQSANQEEALESTESIKNLEEAGMEEKKELPPDEEFLEDIEISEELYDLVPEQPIGLIHHLKMVGDKLLEIAQNEGESEKRQQFYDEIFMIIEEDEMEIQGMIEELNQEVPENVALIIGDIDEKFANASNYFLDAIEYYYQFPETEDPAIVERAMNSIKEGSRILEEADAKAQALQSVPDGSVEA